MQFSEHRRLVLRAQRVSQQSRLPPLRLTRSAAPLMTKISSGPSAAAGGRGGKGSWSHSNVDSAPMPTSASSSAGSRSSFPAKRINGGNSSSSSDSSDSSSSNIESIHTVPVPPHMSQSSSESSSSWPVPWHLPHVNAVLVGSKRSPHSSSSPHPWLAHAQLSRGREVLLLPGSQVYIHLSVTPSLRSVPLACVPVASQVLLLRIVLPQHDQWLALMSSVPCGELGAVP